MAAAGMLVESGGLGSGSTFQWAIAAKVRGEIALKPTVTNTIRN